MGDHECREKASATQGTLHPNNMVKQRWNRDYYY